MGDAGSNAHDTASIDASTGEDVNGLVDATNPVYNISVPDLTAHQNKGGTPNASTRVANISAITNGCRADKNNVSELTKSKAPLATTESIGVELPVLQNGNNEVLLRKNDQRPSATTSVVLSAKSQKPDLDDSNVTFLR